MKKIILALTASISLLVAPMVAADDDAPSYPSAPVITDGSDLYNDFGQKAGLVSLMDLFLVNLLEDKRIERRFRNVDHDFLKEQLVIQFCQILNGPCKYEGANMKEMHANMGIDRKDFYSLVEALRKAMATKDIPFRVQNKLVAALAPMHRDIITR